MRVTNGMGGVELGAWLMVSNVGLGFMMVTNEMGRPVDWFACFCFLTINALYWTLLKPWEKRSGSKSACPFHLGPGPSKRPQC